ncbi:hypothetical protein ACWCPF_15620 [Streptomyces sp. NPDC001858]
MYPTGGRERRMLLHCAHARFVWNLAVEQHAHWRPGRGPAPGFGEPTWRKKFKHEGFRVIGADRVPEYHADGILAQGWGLLRQRTGHKAPGRVEDVPVTSRQDRAGFPAPGEQPVPEG